VIRAIPEVCDAMPTSFTFRVLVPTDDEVRLNEDNLLETVATDLAWHVVWMGIEA
jgi:hypothetical protein